MTRYRRKDMKKNYPRNPHKQRLSVEIPIVMHDKLKEIAVKHNATITQIITELIESVIQYESKFE
jgi:predicted DNA-binding ribbon-helix-helix protein